MDRQAPTLVATPAAEGGRYSQQPPAAVAEEHLGAAPITQRIPSPATSVVPALIESLVPRSPRAARSDETDLAVLKVEATDLPVNADFESGFGSTPDEVAHSVKMAVATGVAGLSIEDSTGDANAPLFPIDEAVARLRAARRAIDETGGDTLLVGRAENFFAGVPDLDDTVARLKAYADAGADCLYAPGIQSAEQIRTVVTAVAPRPVNVLVGATSPFTLQDLADLGVRRVSVGGALARAAWGGFMHAAQALAEGRFDGFDGAASGATLNGLFQPGR